MREYISGIFLLPELHALPLSPPPRLSGAGQFPSTRPLAFLPMSTPFILPLCGCCGKPPQSGRGDLSHRSLFSSVLEAGSPRSGVGRLLPPEGCENLAQRFPGRPADSHHLGSGGWLATSGIPGHLPLISAFISTCSSSVRFCVQVSPFDDTNSTVTSP